MKLIDGSKTQENELNPTSYLIVNGATVHEFMAKWKELMAKYNDTKVVWSKITMLFDCKMQDIK